MDEAAQSSTRARATRHEEHQPRAPLSLDAMGSHDVEGECCGLRVRVPPIEGVPESGMLARAPAFISAKTASYDKHAPSRFPR